MQVLMKMWCATPMGPDNCGFWSSASGYFVFAFIMAGIMITFFTALFMFSDQDATDGDNMGAAIGGTLVSSALWFLVLPLLTVALPALLLYFSVKGARKAKHSIAQRQERLRVQNAKDEAEVDRWLLENR